MPTKRNKNRKNNKTKAKSRKTLQPKRRITAILKNYTFSEEATEKVQKVTQTMNLIESLNLNICF